MNPRTPRRSGRALAWATRALLASAVLLPAAATADVPDGAFQAFEKTLSESPELFEIRRQKSLFRFSTIAPDLAAAMEASQAKSLSGDRYRELVDDDGAIAVTLAPSGPGGADALTRRIESVGGRVTARLDETVLARLTTGQLKKLDQTKGLSQVNLQSMTYPSNLVGEGVPASRADRLHRMGLTGKGAKVGIIDWGFGGYEALHSKGELPRAAAYRSFRRRRPETPDVHGTACAEIVHEMAPDAELYLAEISGSAEQVIGAARWLVAHDVDVISFSGGGHDGPHNGMALLDRLVDDVREQGVLWVNAAGNEGSEHWMAELVDRDANGLVDVDEPHQSADAVFFRLSGSGSFRITINWDDWGPEFSSPRPENDVDLLLLKIVGERYVRVGTSAESMLGRGRPVEFIEGRGQKGDLFAAALVARRLTSPQSVHLYVKGPVKLETAVPRGSIGIPATARGAIAVGAVHVNDGQLAYYSSRGPTDDGRIKPEITAPSNSHTWSYGRDDQPGRYAGTSAACPHVSGFVALLHERYPDASTEELAAKTIAHVRGIGRRTPNNQFGHGHIDGGDVPGSRVDFGPPAGGHPPSSRPPPENWSPPDRREGRGVDLSEIEDLVDEETEDSERRRGPRSPRGREGRRDGSNASELYETPTRRLPRTGG